MVGKLGTLSGAILAGFLVAAPALPSAEAPPKVHGFHGLVAELQAGDFDARLDAVRALGDTKDPRALDPLLDLLTDPAEDPQLRMAAASALGVLADRRAVPVLVAELERDLRVRRGLWASIIPALGMIGDPRAIPALLRALEDRDEAWLGREMAAQALGEIGDRSASQALISAAWMADTRQAAIAALGRIGEPDAAEVFISALDETEDPEVRQAAMDGLRSLGDAAVPALVRALRSHFPEAPMVGLRSRAALLLGQIGDQGAVPALRAAMNDPSPQVRASAEQALRAMGVLH